MPNSNAHLSKGDQNAAQTVKKNQGSITPADEDAFQFFFLSFNLPYPKTSISDIYVMQSS